MKTIIATATDAGKFTTLLTALGVAGLTENRNGAGPFTVFAPTDDAFSKLAPGSVDALPVRSRSDRLTTRSTP